MAMQYVYREGYTSPFSMCPVSDELCKAKLTDYHLRWDSERRRWWCFDVRSYGNAYFYGHASTRKAAYEMLLHRKALYFKNLLLQLEVELGPVEDQVFDSPYGPRGFSNPATTLSPRYIRSVP